MILPSFLGFVAPIVRVIDDVTGNGDQERFEYVDELVTRVQGGDYAAWIDLQCKAGDQSARDEAIRLGIVKPNEAAVNQPCGFKTAPARAYAAAKIAQLKVQGADKRIISPNGTIAQKVQELPPWLVAAGVVVAVLLVVRVVRS